MQASRHLSLFCAYEEGLVLSLEEVLLENKRALLGFSLGLYPMQFFQPGPKQGKLNSQIKLFLYIIL